MRVLVTGGAGFIGSHIIEHLLKRTDADVISLDRLDTSGNLSRLSHIIEKNPQFKDRLSIVFHDLKAELNDRIIAKIGRVSHILHLAAGSHVDRSIRYPMEFVLDNVVGTCNLLNYAKDHCPDLKWLLYFSTDEVFGTAPEGVNFKEWDRYNSGNPYSASKAGAEELCLAYANTYSMPINITHTMNVIGYRQHPEKYVPLCIRKIVNGETIYVHADPTCTKAGSRFYVDANCVSDAVLFLLDRYQELKRGDKFNIVGSKEIDNLSLAKMIAETIGKPLNYELVDFHSSRAGHDLRYSLCGKKMEKMGWKPKTLNDTLERIVKWYLDEKNRLWMEL